MDVIVYAAFCPEGKEHTGAYALLRYALERELDLAELPDIGKTEHGKPFFPQYSHICFNLSHSHGAVVCAIHDKAIGVDIEKLRPAPKRLAKGMGDADFFRRWTAMEATVKRAGKDWRSLLDGPEPDGLCHGIEDLLPGWIITVCPSESTVIRTYRVELPETT